MDLAPDYQRTMPMVTLVKTAKPLTRMEQTTSIWPPRPCPIHLRVRLPKSSRDNASGTHDRGHHRANVATVLRIFQSPHSSVQHDKERWRRSIWKAARCSWMSLCPAREVRRCSPALACL